MKNNICVLKIILVDIIKIPIWGFNFCEKFIKILLQKIVIQNNFYCENL